MTMVGEQNGSSTVKVVLAVGVVIVTVMIIGFVGVFFLMKYQNEEARKLELEKQIAVEKAERSETLGAIGNVLGESLGRKFADKLSAEDVEALKKAASDLGESVGKKIAKAKGPEEIGNALKSASKSFQEELLKPADE